jgi:acetylornithine/succinyldiaminopimelate/putrescine aminotransferase
MIKSVSSAGLMMAVAFDSFETNKKVIDSLLDKGVFTDWFLFAPHCLRIAPPLNISETDIRRSCAAILEVLDSMLQ